MKIAFTSTGTNWDSKIDPRFGRAEYLLIYDEESKNLESIDNTEVSQVAHGAGNSTAQKINKYKPEILITGNMPGGNAFSVLKMMNVKIFTDAYDMTIKEAYQKYLDGKLQEAK